MSNIFDIINIPFGYVVRFCYFLTQNYALALLLFAIIVKAVLFPLGIKQQKNQVRQAKLRPKELAIRKKYAGRTDKATQQKMNEEIMSFYQKENFNPAGGCLPMLIELPIIMSLYTIITHPLKYICMFTETEIASITERISTLELTAPSQIDMVKTIRDNFSSFADILREGFTAADLPDFGLFGLDLAATPSFKEPSWLLVIPVLTFIVVFASMKITRHFTYTPPESGDAAKSMKIMDYTMPLFSVWITFTVPAVVGLYWLYQNILSALRQFILYKIYPIPVFTEEEMKAAEREVNGKVTKNKAAAEKTRSLHHIDDDDIAEQKKAVEETKAKLPPPALKDESDRAVPKAEPQNKPKRSLHHIDDEEEAPAENAPANDKLSKSDGKADTKADGESGENSGEADKK